MLISMIFRHGKNGSISLIPMTDYERAFLKTIGNDLNNKTVVVIASVDISNDGITLIPVEDKKA